MKLVKLRIHESQLSYCLFNETTVTNVSNLDTYKLWIFHHLEEK